MESRDDLENEYSLSSSHLGNKTWREEREGYIWLTGGKKGRGKRKKLFASQKKSSEKDVFD